MKIYIISLAKTWHYQNPPPSWN